MSEEGVDLWGFLETCTPEAKWFLKALQHFSSKAEDRAEIRLYDYEDPSDGFIATTHKSSLHIGLGENLLCFSFKRKITAPPATSLGRWCLPIKEEKGKAIIREVREAVLKVPLPLGEILEIVKKIDDIIREEEVGGEEEEE
jgi:hypothetical protein